MKITHLLSATALAGSLLTLPSVAFAQTKPAPAPSPTNITPEGEPQTGETIIVTGSRIARPEYEGTLPGVQVSAQTIDSRGFTNALEAVNDIPLVGNGASPLNGNNGGQTASLGAAFVDLLDLGTARTLTLVNGRRFVSGNAASLFVAGNETGSQVDVNVIPSTLIQRIDILTVGGAAAYGADAVAGVVNYVLRTDYEGYQVRAVSGISERGDAPQYQLSALAGWNLFDGRANVMLSAEYSRNDGLQAISRDFRNARPGTYTNPFNGGIRNPAFTGTAVIDVTNLNNGAFLRASDDGQPSTLFGMGLVTQTLSYAGTVLNVNSTTFYTPYTPITSGSGSTLRTSNYITLANGVAPVGFAINATTTTGARTTITTPNNGNWTTTGQIISGTPGVGLSYNNGTTIGNLSSNGLNGRTTQATNVPFTTFAPTALPSNVTSAQVLAAYGVTAPTGSTAAQQTAIAVNLLQANRFTAREFLAANPTTNLNYFIGTFAPDVPRIANTDTSLVNVKVNGSTVQVPVNQVLPYVAVPLEFNDDGSLHAYTFSGAITGNAPLTVGASRGGNGGFTRSLENTVLRTQQDRYVFNANARMELFDGVTFFTENTYANILNRSLGNISGAQNFLTTTQENAALMVNYNNPYLTAQNRAVLTQVGITPTATNQGNFLITRQNQDIFGANPYTNRQETYRIAAGLESKFELLGKSWNAEISATYGNSKQNTRSWGIADVEYQLALDAVDQGLATTGVANGNIVCRAQVFPNQYLGKTPIGTAENITRVAGSDGLPTEVLVTPTITQAMINSCKPLNPFGYNQMSDASKAYVMSPSLFRNFSEQTFVQASVGGGLFDLPAGTLQVNMNGEYRRDHMKFSTNELNRLGRSRSAPSANTDAFTETYEFGGEAAVPITGSDFLGFLGKLEFNPGFRMTKQSGQAQTYRNLAGNVITPSTQGKWNTIYSLGGTWAPVRDILFRGNYTKSVRQPSIVELFLGGQPVFTTPTDYCSPANIDSGAVPGTRRANCVKAAIANGNATDTASATTFLAGFSPAGAGLQGTYSGAPNLRPERGTSWTIGTVLRPRWVPGLTLSADFFNLRLDDTIVPVGLATIVQTCYDSPTYPDPSPSVGVNTCNQFSRDSSFQIQNGYQAGFLNLGAIKIKAINFSGDYTLNLGSDKLILHGNAYYLINYDTSSSGNFDDTQASAGSRARPSLKTQFSMRYEHDGIYGQVTWNRESPTRIFSSGLPATNEQYPYTRYPTVNNIDMALGMDIDKSFRLQLAVSNLLDQTTVGDLGYRFADYYDQIGRRYKITATTRF
ncbi:MAG: TonB-dependent receptor [Sphingomonas sp.]|uniref:TonB-dependent receptor domain-containing protein n=1 Tax=Sphingomonas sp. TaxID=28214 RepID=UPI0025E2FD69|nr:TonB-dependent receptor [Sphingomonas sp.]MBQ1500672.1 TonB-dependent receptor [Sphingomonas sp.]